MQHVRLDCRQTAKEFGICFAFESKIGCNCRLVDLVLPQSPQTYLHDGLTLRGGRGKSRRKGTFASPACSHLTSVNRRRLPWYWWSRAMASSVSILMGDRQEIWALWSRARPSVWKSNCDRLRVTNSSNYIPRYRSMSTIYTILLGSAHWTLAVVSDTQAYTVCKMWISQLIAPRKPIDRLEF